MNAKQVHQRTITVPLDVSEEQRQLFIRVIELYNKAWSNVVSWCTKNHSVNRSRLQKELYHELRETYPELPSQFISIALRDAAGSVKTWNANNKKKTLGNEGSTPTLDAQLRPARHVHAGQSSVSKYLAWKQTPEIPCRNPQLVHQQIPWCGAKCGEIISEERQGSPSLDLPC